MKNFKLIVVFICALLLVGCATKKGDSTLRPYQSKSAQQIFVSAQTNLQKKKYDAAIKDFNALDALYPYGKYSQQGHLDIIYAYYKNGDYDAAVAVANRYIHLYPRGVGVDYAYYLKGLAYFDKNKNWLQHIHPLDPAQRDLTSYKQAFVSFEELVEKFPDSQYYPDARDRMIYIRGMIARHELEVARFYMKHKAYVAAANRASDVVSHFQGTKEVPDALVIMIKAYRALGANQQANDALRVLKLNYPKVKVK